MLETIAQPGLSVPTLKNMEAYFNTHDVQYVTEDAVFINMSNGEETRGRKAIAEMLHFFYHVAFDARAEIKHTIVTENSAVLEFTFIGQHIGALGDLRPTNKIVRVPSCVVYDLENGLIKKARIYMLNDVMIKQLTASN